MPCRPARQTAWEQGPRERATWWVEGGQESGWEAAARGGRRLPLPPRLACSTLAELKGLWMANPAMPPSQVTPGGSANLGAAGAARGGGQQRWHARNQVPQPSATRRTKDRNPTHAPLWRPAAPGWHPRALLTGQRLGAIVQRVQLGAQGEEGGGPQAAPHRLGRQDVELEQLLQGGGVLEQALCRQAHGWGCAGGCRAGRGWDRRRGGTGQQHSLRRRLVRAAASSYAWRLPTALRHAHGTWPARRQRRRQWAPAACP